MPNELAKKGAQSGKPTRYGVLWNNNFYQGIVTQRNPLRANLGHIEEEFYGSQICLLDGLNCEISSKLTLVRRPGSKVYNSSTYPAVTRFYENRMFNSSTEKIQVVADTASAIYDVTADAVTAVANNPNPIFNKSAGAGSTYFLGVGNNLYFSDGVDSQKIVDSLVSWAPSTTEDAGTYIVDSNGNLQIAIGSQTATITNIQITEPSTGVYLTTVFFSSLTQLDVPLGTKITFSGLTSVAALNTTTQTVTGVPNGQQIQFLYGSTPQLGYFPETGAATTGNGETGSSVPTWQSTLGSITQDSGAQWECRGSQVEGWGIAPPSGPPSVTQAPAPSIYPSWTLNSWYAPLFIIADGGVLYQLTQEGTTGGSAPTFDPVVGHVTTDGSCKWTSLGTATWSAGTAYAVGQAVQATFTYYYTTYEMQQQWDGYSYVWVEVPVQASETVISLFACTSAGTSQTPGPPAWTNGVGTTVTDGSVGWTNQGTAPAWPGATQHLLLAAQILDSNKNLQKPTKFGETGGTAPTWGTSVGAYTVDNNQTWVESGAFGKANTGAWIYAYSYVNSLTDTVSTADPQSAPITVSAGNFAVIQGIGSSDPQVDTIYLWRTAQGGSTLFYLDQIPNPGANQTWIYTDTTPDLGLDELIEAPIALANNPPPTGLSALVYYLGRIWGAVNNSVYFSAGPDVTVGNGNEAWPPSNVFVFPDSVFRLFPTTSGLLVFTASNVYIIQGLGTQTSSFFSTPFLPSYLGLLSYDGFAANGSIIFMYTSDNQVVTLDASSGVSEVGFPIGDQFGPGNGTGTFNPTSTRVTWHISGSQDKGLYVSDFNGTWWRMCPTPSPESGTTWSPRAEIVGGFSAVQSVEVIPGTHELLLGPKVSGPILKRDYSVYTDDGTAYSSYAVLGSMVIAQPGQLGSVESFTTDSVLVGNPISLAIQLDEIAPLSAGYFEPLTLYVQDPAELEPSLSVYAQRFYVSQTQKPAKCRHLQLLINFGEDTVKNELLSATLYGSFDQEK